MTDATPKGSAALKSIDALIVLDISDVKRLGNLADSVRALTKPKVVIDHHVPSNEPPGETILADTTACATGELIYDFACTLDLEITPAIARALYIAMLTDTGGFRFSNTSPRCHAIAARAARAGVDPEEMYVRIYASAPAGRIRLLAEVLATPRVDEGSASPGCRWAPACSRSTTCGRRTSTASSSTRGRSPARGWRSSSATSGTAR